MKRSVLASAIVVCGAWACEQETVQTVKPLMEVRPTAIEFGEVVVGVPVTRTVEVLNRGEVAFRFKRATTEGTEFSLSFDVRSVPPADTLTIAVTFQPLSAGEKTSTLIVEVEELEAVQVSLAGRGVDRAISIEPRPLDFGSVLVGTRETEQTTITNLLPTPLDITVALDASIDACSAPARTSQYCVDTSRFDAGSRIHLDPGASKALDIEFAPVAEGRTRSSITFTPCDGCGNVRLDITGAGAASALACDPPALDFGRVNPGRCSEQTVSCENVTTLPVSIVRWGIEASSSPAFTVEPLAARVELAPGAAQEIRLDYCPTLTREDRGSLEILTDPSGPLAVSLHGSGGGPAIVVTPASLDFGVASRAVAKLRPILITNAGQDDLIVSELIFSDAGRSFSVASGGGGFSLPSGGTRVVELAFLPFDLGANTADLIIRSNDDGQRELRVPLRGDGVDLPPCLAAVRPDTLGFGVVPPERTARRLIEIDNMGDSECLVYDARLTGTTPVPFTIETPLPERIAARGLERIAVEYAPLNPGTHASSVQIYLSNETLPQPVALTGTSAGGDLLIVPRDLHFGQVGVGCASRTMQVRVHNITSLTVAISSIELVAPGGGFVVENIASPLPGSPLMLGSGGSTTFDVSFRPEAVRAHSGAVIVHSTLGAGAADYVVSLEGIGAIDPVQTDQFVQLGHAMADILFVIDNSCSMGDEQVSLAANLAAFIEYATREAVDYNIAIATLDNAVPGFGLFVPVNGPPADRLITPSTQPSPEDAFSRNANVGAVGPGPEMGLEATYAALSEPNLSMHNFGFLRREAVLSIIVVSDQPDLSPGADDFYYSFMLSVKGAQDPSALTFSAITGEPNGCTGPGGSAQAGNRYIDMVNRTGGVHQSICTSDWAQSLEQLSSTAFGFRHRFFLSGAPVPESLEVRVDGMLIPPNAGTWTYDPMGNSVTFAQVATPEPGVHIDVTYAIACLP